MLLDRAVSALRDKLSFQQLREISISSTRTRRIGNTSYYAGQAILFSIPIFAAAPDHAVLFCC